MADSEVRQKFEARVLAFWKENGRGMLTFSVLVKMAEEIFAEGMRAGEIAMKEKAAGLAKSCAEILSPEQTVGARWIGDKIRQLPLSGAEESQKEKP